MSRWRLEDLYIGDYVSASKTGKTYAYYGYLSTSGYSSLSSAAISVANPLSTRSSKMFKINSVTGKGTTATITLKSKVTADQLFGLACTTRKDYKSTIKKGNTCQFKIKLKGNGKTISATATAKVGSNKITIKTKKLTKGKTYVLQDCYYGGWLDSQKGGNKKISFKAK